VADAGRPVCGNGDGGSVAVLGMLVIGKPARGVGVMNIDCVPSMILPPSGGPLDATDVAAAGDCIDGEAGPKPGDCGTLALPAPGVGGRGAAWAAADRGPRGSCGCD
jgi:hypothetical protein